ncbi:MAG TPA: FxsA family protein [Conexibacter sp.]|jgi:UPF0716 protein FxsA
MFLLVFLLILVPAAELFVIIQVGEAIGALPTLRLLLLSSILGGTLLRSQGRIAWRRFRDAIAAGRPPGREVVDGALVVLGGSLLIVPGFISDAVGLLLLLPPTRVFARRLLIASALRRFLPGGAILGGAARSRGRQDYDVDSTAHDVDGIGRQLRR